MSRSTRRTLLGTGGAVFVMAPFAAGNANVEELDGELIRICAEHIENIRAYNTDSCACYADMEDDPLWQAYDRTRDALTKIEPKTVAGILAKCRVAKAEAQQPDGEDPQTGMGAELAWDIVNDLLRVFSEGMAVA